MSLQTSKRWRHNFQPKYFPYELFYNIFNSQTFLTMIRILRCLDPKPHIRFSIFNFGAIFRVIFRYDFGVQGKYASK
ncbi:hypothetical protein BD408DRAFT_419679, partial [Parasitella parasitica]